MTPLFSRATDGCILSFHSHSYTNITPERTVAGLVEKDSRECEWSSALVFRVRTGFEPIAFCFAYQRTGYFASEKKHTHRKNSKKIDPRPRPRSWPFYT